MRIVRRLRITIEKMKKVRDKNLTLRITKEIGLEFVNLIFGNVYTKIGISLVFLIIGLVLIFANFENGTQKPQVFYILGFISIIVSLVLVLIRYSELKEKFSDKEV